MISLRRIHAVIRARLREFYRDRASFMWNLAMPMMIIVGFAGIFGDDPRDVLVIGVISQHETLAPDTSPLQQLKYIKLVPVQDRDLGIEKVRRHQLDLLVQPADPPLYWVNDNSAKGTIAEQLLLGLHAATPGNAQRQAVSGRNIRYVDWLMPGVLAMNLMFSCLWGVGWVVVRYRKNGVLRRLRATPLTAMEFLTAQVLSRLLVVVVVSTSIYAGAAATVDFTMRGSHLALFLVFLSGALSLISIGLLVATRIRSEELADGLLNLASWPMMILSGVWFSLEDATPATQALAQAFPLTHLVDAAREIMLDGAGLAEVMPEIIGLASLGVILIAVSARMFRWE